MTQNKWHKDGDKPTNGEIFIFGSNTCGIHGAGAALEAHKNYGAIYRLGIGLHGQSYAVATLDSAFEKVPLALIKIQVDVLFDEILIKDCDEKQWFITRIGCGLAGFKDEEIAPMFFYFTRIKQVSLPEVWKPFLEQ